MHVSILQKLPVVNLSLHLGLVRKPVVHSILRAQVEPDTVLDPEEKITGVHGGPAVVKLDTRMSTT